jgi:hypothetical protein
MRPEGGVPLRRPCRCNGRPTGPVSRCHLHRPGRWTRTRHVFGRPPAITAMQVEAGRAERRRMEVLADVVERSRSAQNPASCPVPREPGPPRLELTCVDSDDLKASPTSVRCRRSILYARIAVTCHFRPLPHLVRGTRGGAQSSHSRCRSKPVERGPKRARPSLFPSLRPPRPMFIGCSGAFGPVSKTGMGVSPSGVRIPPLRRFC